MSYIKSINVIKKWDKIKSLDLIIIGKFENQNFSSELKIIGKEGQNTLRIAEDLGDVKGKIGETSLFYSNGARFLIIGLGKKDELNSQIARNAAGKIIRIALKKKLGSIAMECFSNSNEICQAIGEGLVLGSYQFHEHKTDRKEKFDIDQVIMVGGDQDSLNKGVTIGKAVCFGRDLSNHPGNITTPTRLAEAAKEISDDNNVGCVVFNREEIIAKGMGGLAGVAQGTDEPPKFIILEYFGADKSIKPKILVGKGLTFDAGGISIKPASKMDEMKFDMCGGALVLSVMKAITELKPKINVVGIVPSTENLVGAKAYKPGDILTAYNGKTIEVLNTDAEGRIILADGLSYACKHYNPEFILDFATLTGAVLVALGHIATGVLGTDKKLMKRVKKSSKRTGEKIWELPLWVEYQKQVKSKIADVKNTGAPRQAGTIAGAAFLNEFVDNGIPWVHFDIAGTAWGQKPDSINPPGSATGWGVRLILDLLKV
tara:strand:- start:3726 stop:5186 length:1461 start_codon:yes stop_codon:yes gene_type:complete